MPKRLALAGLVISTLAIVMAYGLAFFPGGGGTVAPLLMIFGIAAMTISFMLLGASRTGRRLGILVPAFAVVFVILAGGFALALLLDVDASRLMLGLPTRAAIVIYGVGFLPVFILPFVYAATFEERTLSDEDLKKVREAAE
jgi:hypothetical protein